MSDDTPGATLSSSYYLTMDDAVYAPDAVLIINKWMSWAEHTMPAQQIAARILSEIVAGSEASNGTVRCDDCGGGAALFSINRKGRDPNKFRPSEDICLWCVADIQKRIEKNG